MIQGLRERYLKPGGLFELPVDLKFRVNLARKGAGDLVDIEALQFVLAENLRNYWSVITIVFI